VCSFFLKGSRDHSALDRVQYHCCDVLLFNLFVNKGEDVSSMIKLKTQVIGVVCTAE
jgi:hypothetical protein